MFTRSDWLESDEGNLHRHDETEEVEGDVGNVYPRGKNGRKGGERRERRWDGEGENDRRERRDEREGRDIEKGWGRVSYQ